MDPFLGEVRIFPISFVPKGWLACEGQTLPINQNQALFSLLGVTYGGNGTTTFMLPDLRGRVPVHASPTVPAGAQGGENSHTLTINEMPQHIHTVNAGTTAATATDPEGKVWAQVASPYHTLDTATPMNAGAIGMTGGSQPHNNMQPYLAVAFCIAVQGIYPPRG